VTGLGKGGWQKQFAHVWTWDRLMTYVVYVQCNIPGVFRSGLVQAWCRLDAGLGQA